jgi:hypothetical protein
MAGGRRQWTGVRLGSGVSGSDGTDLIAWRHSAQGPMQHRWIELWLSGPDGVRLKCSRDGSASGSGECGGPCSTGGWRGRVAIKVGGRRGRLAGECKVAMRSKCEVAAASKCDGRKETASFLNPAYIRRLRPVKVKSDDSYTCWFQSLTDKYKVIFVGF